MSPETINGIYALGGAALGAVLTGFFAWIISKRQDKFSELTTISTVPTKLIEIDRSVSEVVTVTVGGKAVPTIFAFDVRIFNSGTETLESVDLFVDVAGVENLIAGTFFHANFDIEDEECFVVTDGITSSHMHFAFLNAGDEVVAQFLVPDKPAKINVNFRQPGVRYVSRSDYDPLVPGVLGRAFFDAIRSNSVLHLYMRLALPQYRRYLNQIKEEQGHTDT